MKTALLALGALLFVQQPQDATTPSNLYLRRNDGETMTGQLVALEGDKVKLKVSIMGGNMTVTHKLSDFDTVSAFRIELAAAKPADFDGHFTMAKKAADMKLRAQAGSEARAAIEAAKGSPDADKKKAEVRAWAADALEKMIAHSVAAGELEDARHCLKLLTTRLPETRTEEQFSAIAASVEGLEATKKQQKDTARQANLDAKQRDAIAKRMKPIEDDVAKANKRYQDAVRKSRSTTASTKLCEEAIDLYKKAYKALQALLEKNADDAQLADTAATMGKEMQDSAIRAALHAANMLCIQSDYKNAMDWTQRILAFDPENEEAKAMARTITIAEASASDDWGWGWNIGHIGNTPQPKQR